jgi:hypothetical protein
MFVVQAEKVQEAVEHEDFQFGFEGVTEFFGLGGSALMGDGEVAERFRCERGEREDVGGAFLAEESGVEPLEFGVGGDAAMEVAAGGDLVT